MVNFRNGLLFVLAFWLAAPVGAADLVIPGTGDSELILTRLAEAFVKSHPQHKVFVPPSVGSAGGVRAIIDKQAVLGRVARVLKAEEAAAGVKALPFARDAVVFATGERVNLTSLTETQLADVFAGRVANWREVGGEAAPIRLLVREESDSSLAQIRMRLAPFRTLQFGTDAKLVAKTPEMIEMLSRYKSAIGWATYSSLQSQSGKVRALAIGGVPPSLATIAGGKYALTAEYALVYREGGLTPEAREFLAFLASSTAQDVLHKHGIVPLLRK